MPLETRYYEGYSQPNVALVDTRARPIEWITPTGIRTSGRPEYGFDIIVYATGFDALRGAFDRIDFTGRNGVAFSEGEVGRGAADLSSACRSEGFPIC